MKKIIILFTIIYNNCGFGQITHNLITSSSKTGKYITAKQLNNNQCDIYNIKNNHLIISLGNVTPISWINDSKLIYFKMNKKKINIFKYSVLEKNSICINSFDLKWFDNNVLQSEFSFPKLFRNEEDLSIYYINEKCLYKLSLSKTEAPKIIGEVDLFLGKHDLHNFSISGNQENIVFISSDEKWGYLNIYNIRTKKTILLKKSTSILSYDSYVYYTKDDKKIVYYETLNNQKTDEVYSNILCFDLSKLTIKKIGRIKNCQPSIFFDIPLKKAIYMNIFCPNITVNLKDDFLKNLIKNIDKSFLVNSFYYEK